MLEHQQHTEKLLESQRIIQENIDKRYLTIKKCFDENDKNDKTIISNFQQIGADLEEYFRLSYEQPDYQISCICEYIIKHCKARGFTQNQYEYVYDAFSGPQYAKYKRTIDLSSSGSLDSSRKRKEDSSVRLSLFKSKLKEAYDLVSEVGVIERDDHQKVWEVGMDFVDSYEKKIVANNIPIANSKQTDVYESGNDETKNKITYPETKPARTRLVEAIERHSKVLAKVAKIVESEGTFHLGTGTQMLTDEQINKMADAWDTVTELFEPVLDRKWRMDHLHWFNIIKVADEWFKHTGATASKVQDYYGRWRSITREHVGARKENMPPFFNKVIEMMPHLSLFFSIWMSNVRIKQGAEFSTDLGPKLSEQSMR